MGNGQDADRLAIGIVTARELLTDLVERRA